MVTVVVVQAVSGALRVLLHRLLHRVSTHPNMASQIPETEIKQQQQ
jgi:hypothetical protein